MALSFPDVATLLELVRDPLFVVDARSLRLTYANDGATAQLGYDKQELDGMSLLHIARRRDEVRWRSALRPFTQGGPSSIHIAETHRHRDGTDIPVDVEVRPLRDDGGTAHSFVMVARDTRVDDLAEVHDAVAQKLFAAALAVHAIIDRSDDRERAPLAQRLLQDLDDAVGLLRSSALARQRRVEMLRFDGDRSAAERL